MDTEFINNKFCTTLTRVPNTRRVVDFKYFVYATVFVTRPKPNKPRFVTMRLTVTVMQVLYTNSFAFVTRNKDVASQVRKSISATVNASPQKNRDLLTVSK